MTRPPALALLLALIALLQVAACNRGESPHRDLLSSETKRYSQGNEELVIRDFFQDRRDGFFVDVGCAWPVKISTTYYLEKHLGWKGIGIDALPEYAPAWAKQRPASKFFAYLVGDRSGPEESFYRSPLKGISSTRQDLAAGKALAPDTPGLPTQEIQVPTITLNDLLDREGVTKIDFLSMDIEGHEPPALAGFDIERFSPALVCIEAGLNRAELLRYFEKHGYERIDRYLEHDEVNWYFRPKTATR